MIYIPVVTRDEKSFLEWTKHMTAKSDTANIMLTRSKLVLHSKEYFYVSGPHALRGKRFKDFITYGNAFLRPDFGEIMDLIRMEIAHSKRGDYDT